MSDLRFIELPGGFGDLLVALPAIHALARSSPGCRLTALTVEPAAELLRFDPWVAETIGVPISKREGDHSARDAVERLLATRSLDLVVSDTNYEGIEDMVRSCSARQKVWNLWRQPPADQLVGDRFLSILAEEGLIEPSFLGQAPRVTLGQEDRAWAQRWRGGVDGGEGKVVFLNPNAGMPIKRWPISRFIDLGRMLLGRGDVRLVVLDAGEGGEPARLVAALGGATLLPRLRLCRLAAAFTQGALLISPDTGPARLAEAVGTPAIVLFGPTWKGRYGLHPPSLNVDAGVECPVRRPENFTLQSCWYSGQCVFSHRLNCVEDIRPRTVLEAANRLLGPPGAG